MAPFPINKQSPIRFFGPAPEAVDVVVIGGGVIGVTTALYLLRKGLSVALIEKGRIAGEQSSRNWGWIRAQGRDRAEIPLMLEARGLWRGLEGDCGTDLGLRRTGATYLAGSEKKMRDFERWLEEDARGYQLDTRLLDARETAAMFPEMKAPAVGAIHTPSDMRGEPWTAVPALAALAAREGVSIVENCAARRLDIAAGRVAGVHTEQGLIRTGDVVLAGGAWSALFLRAHGVSLPQLSVRSTAAATEPLDSIHEGAAANGRVAFRRRADGGYTLAPGSFNELYIGPDAFRAAPKFFNEWMSDPFKTRLRANAPNGFPDGWRTPRAWEADEESPFERMRILDPEPNPGKLRQITQDFSRLFPGVGPVKLKTAWAGMIDVMPDVVPVVDRCAALPGLTIGTGMSGHGFGVGPGMGRVLADLAMGADPGHDLHRFRLSRFSDGSRLHSGPKL